jgi:hypothetical protein
LILENHKEIKQIYENLDISLLNRDSDNWLPLFAIAKFIDSSKGEDIFAENQIKKYLESYKELQIEGNDDKGEFFRILYEKLGEKEEYYTPKIIF